MQRISLVPGKELAPPNRKSIGDDLMSDQGAPQYEFTADEEKNMRQSGSDVAGRVIKQWVDQSGKPIGSAQIKPMTVRTILPKNF